MKNFKFMTSFALCCLALTGCFTLRQTEKPSVVMAQAPGDKTVKVALSGFAAVLTEYIPIYGYETYYVEGGHYRGRRGRYYSGGHLQTTTTETLVPQTRANGAFMERAQSMLEESGFLLRASPADYTVDVTFGGPYVTDDEQAVETAWMFCSLLSAEYSTQTWTAKLKIYDAKSGRVLFHRDYTQKYENTVWSPLLFIGLAGYSRNTYNYMQCWCLTVLTDRTMADTTAWLASDAAK